MRDHDFGNSFRRTAIDPLNEFVETWDSVEKEFIDKKLEKDKKELFSVAMDLSEEIARLTVPVAGGEFSSVYSDHQRQLGQSRPKSVIEDARILNEISRKFVTSYESFVRKCKVKLSS